MSKSNSTQIRNISRRRVLQGLGVSLALPWFESSMVFGSSLSTPQAPRRMAFLSVPNGIHMEDWTPTSDGFGFSLPYVMQPLSNVRDDITVLTGLTHDKGRANGDGPGDHARSASSFLTGAQPRKTDGNNIRVGTSVDQVAAQGIGSATKFPSLQLGCERGRSAGNCDSGYSCAYSSSISWSSESTPLGKEVDPKLVFERLFGGGGNSTAKDGRGRREAFKQSILDFVADDARRLQSSLSRNDQQKLDQYLTGVREVELRISKSVGGAAAKAPASYEAPTGVPSDYEQHIRLLCDMMVLAFHSDLTRICTFMLADEGSNKSYRFIDIPDGHHDLSHHGGDPKKHAKIRDINRFHVRQLAYLLEKLKSIPDGNGTLLDQCMVVYGSGIGDGNRHNHDNLPVLLAGRGGGSIDPGRHIRYEIETPMCNLFLSLLDRVGVNVDFIGDSTGRLSGLQI